jgi:hypothetical protein
MNKISFSFRHARTLDNQFLSRKIRISNFPHFQSRDRNENSMTLDELKAELDLRNVDYSDCISKKELSDKLASSRLSGRADPKILDQFNSKEGIEIESGEKTNVFESVDLDNLTAKDGTLPGGMSPAMMKVMASDPEIMNMLKDAKMQEMMRAMMNGGRILHYNHTNTIFNIFHFYI